MNLVPAWMHSHKPLQRVKQLWAEKLEGDFVTAKCKPGNTLLTEIMLERFGLGDELDKTVISQQMSYCQLQAEMLIQTWSW